jgi:hypothetical protein
MALPLVEHNSTHLDQKEETHRDDLGLLLSSSSTTEEDCKACQYQWSLGAEDWVEQLLGSSGSSTSEEYICRTKQTKYDAPTLLRLKNSPFAVASKLLLKVLLDHLLLHVHSLMVSYIAFP